MNYRIVKEYTWWSTAFDMGTPQYLFWDEEEDHFEVGSYGTARNHLWVFTEEWVQKLRDEHSCFDKEFMLEEAK